MYRLLFIFIFLSFIPVSAQLETNQWYFGDRSGIIFSSNNDLPTALTDSKMYSHEGCASICSRNGDLLFYTNGEVVWDRNHDTMPQGHQLMGKNSSTQSSLIIPFPFDSNKYYIFTTQDVSTSQNIFCYSVVDMTLNGGLGDVMYGNMVLHTNVCEKLTAAINPYDSGYWVIVHEWGMNKFLSYRVASDGVSSEPVESINGIIPTYNNISNKIGYMKISPDGSMLAMATYAQPTFELFRFDNATGKVSDGIVLGNDSIYYKSYGIEFSPDCNKLYVSSYNKKSYLFQFDLNALWLTIPGTLEIIAEKNEYFGALQLGRDGKIYCATMDSCYLSVITNPSSTGSACGYIYKGVPLKRKCKSGLPNFLPDFFYTPAIELPESIELCEGGDFTLSCPYRLNVKYSWVGPRGFSSDKNEFTLNDCKPEQSGYYYLTVYVGKRKSTDSTLVKIHPKPEPIILPSNNIILVEGYSKIVKIAGKYDHVNWSTNETTDSIVIDKGGDYYVTVTDSNGCSQTAYFKVTSLKASVEFPDDEDFGKLIVGDRITKSFKIRNTGEIDISITDLKIPSAYSAFQDNTGSLSLPLTIEPGKEAECTVTFNPPDVRDYYDSLHINISLPDDPSYASKTLYLKGSGLGSLRFFLPDTISNVYNRKLSIPLFCDLNTVKTDFKGILSYTVLISLDALILLPVDILFKRNIRVTGIHAGRRYIEFSGKDVPVHYGLNILDSLNGEPRISENIYSSLKIESINIPNVNYSYSGIDGSLGIYGICQSNLSRVKSFDPLEASITPIPAEDYADLTIKGIDNGADTYINIYNAQGQECKYLSAQLSGQYRIDIKELSPGIYNVIIKNGEQVRSIPLVVFR